MPVALPGSVGLGLLQAPQNGGFGVFRPGKIAPESPSLNLDSI